MSRHGPCAGHGKPENQPKSHYPYGMRRGTNHIARGGDAGGIAWRTSVVDRYLFLHGDTISRAKR